MKRLDTKKSYNAIFHKASTRCVKTYFTKTVEVYLIDAFFYFYLSYLMSIKHGTEFDPNLSVKQSFL